MPRQRYEWEKTQKKVFLPSGAEITLVGGPALVGASRTALDVEYNLSGLDDYSGDEGVASFESADYTYPVFIDYETGKLFYYVGTGH